MAAHRNVMDLLQDGRRNGRPVYKAPGPVIRRPSTSFAVSRDDISELRTFVRRLFATPRQSADEAWARRKLVASLSNRSGLSSSDPREFGRSLVARTDLASHVERLSDAASLWFEGGEPIPPLLAERVQLFLRRSGRLAWEKAFLAVFCLHFANGHDGRYDGLVTRAVELRVHPLPRRAAGNRRTVAQRPRLAARPAA
jgi:hypothetical protein